MYKLLIGAIIVLIAQNGMVYADVPSPLPGIRLARDLGPIPTAVIGVALSLAVAVGGIRVTRAYRSKGIAVLTILGVPVMLLITLFYVGLSVNNRRPDHFRRPVPPSEVPVRVQLAVSVVAATPANGFPEGIPWAAIAVNADHGSFVR